MQIYHNMKADNTHRMLGINSSTLAKSTEKLSSGLRVNRAADDAAGLSISEKMRGQIRGLNQASRNAQDAISVVQTAEGALDEAHSILQRMRQLAVQSANDSNVNIDRSAIQDEVTQLTDELDRIAGTTQFNTMNLLDGTFKAKTFHVGANQDQNIQIDIEDLTAQGLGLRTKLSATKANISSAVASAKGIGESIAALKVSVAGLQSKVRSINGTIGAAKGSKNLTGLKKMEQAIKASIGNLLAKEGGVGEASAAQQEKKLVSVRGSISGHNAKINSVQNKIKQIRVLSGASSIDYKEKQLDSLNAVINAKGGVLVHKQETANRAITTINDALSMVSKQRSFLGAIQNRMEHTIKNVDNAAENLQAAEARIRDTDMAKEISEFTKKNILTQASQAMLAQANQLPNQVLQLLR